MCFFNSNWCPMKITVALKLDFKIDEKGVLRIVDLGDGFGAGQAGFDVATLPATILRNLHDMTGAPLVSLFGELPSDALHPITMDIPIVQRTISANRAPTDLNDISASDCASLIPYTEAVRIQSYISAIWASKLNNIQKTPMALMAMEMHKVLWYELLQKHIALKFHEKVIYWMNDDANTALDLSMINMQHGVFIKIADRSSGGGNGVFYAKNALEVTKRLDQLHKDYSQDQGDYKKHMFVIEPAYLTVRLHEDRPYNVTGRTFITLGLDLDTDQLQVNVAAAKWMFPLEPLQGSLSQNQMLSNVEHSIKMVSLNAEELSNLSQQIVTMYGDTFKAGMTHDNIMDYCKESPMISAFQAILRPNASYKLILDLTSPKCQMRPEEKKQLINSMLHSLILRDYLGDNPLWQESGNASMSFFPKQACPEDLLRRVGYLSFLECYVRYVNGNKDMFSNHPRIANLLRNETQITLHLDKYINQFLQLKNPNYDRKDLNRALRQAAAVGDIDVLKLLTGTNRALINARSPQTQQSALDFALKSKCDEPLKSRCIRFLTLSGAVVKPSAIEEEQVSAAASNN